MNAILELMGFCAALIAVAYVLFYLSWEVIIRYADRNDWEEQDYVETKDGKKIPYDEDTQE